MDNNINGIWKEVRNEEVGINIGLQPALELEFQSFGKMRIKEYNTPNSKYTSGKYKLNDSILVFTPDNEPAFREYLHYTDFIIETYNEELLILRTNHTTKLPNFKYYFIPDQVFKKLNEDEIKNNYSYTPEDSIREQEYIRKKERLAELRKNDRSAPQFPGGNEALNNYLSEHIIFPKNHSTTKLVKVFFDVKIDGQIVNIQVNTPSDSTYTREAIRLIEAMPNWLPAIFNGKPTQLNTRLTIRFEKK